MTNLVHRGCSKPSAGMHAGGKPSRRHKVYDRSSFRDGNWPHIPALTQKSDPGLQADAEMPGDVFLKEAYVITAP
jgi:hypothetical protein